MLRWIWNIHKQLRIILDKIFETNSFLVIFYKSHTANENSSDRKEAIKTLPPLKMQKVNTTLSCRWNCRIQKLALKPIGSF